MTKTGWVLIAISVALFLVGGGLYLAMSEGDREFAVLLLRLSPTPLPLAISLLMLGARQNSS